MNNAEKQFSFIGLLFNYILLGNRKNKHRNSSFGDTCFYILSLLNLIKPPLKANDA